MSGQARFAPNYARLLLREATRDLHGRVDEAFAGFDLTSPRGYARLLLAHGRALPPVEHALARPAQWSGWTPRAMLVAEDLAELGLAMPPTTQLSPLCDAASWGAQYVLEGAKLGGRLLVQRVGAGLPRHYLGAAHGPGQWARFQGELNAAAEAGSDGWIALAIAGARAVFARFEDAVAEDLDEAA